MHKSLVAFVLLVFLLAYAMENTASARGKADAPDFIHRDFILQFRAGTTDVEVDAFLGLTGGEVVVLSATLEGRYRVRFEDEVPDGIEEFTRIYPIEFIQPNWVWNSTRFGDFAGDEQTPIERRDQSDGPNDPKYPSQRALHRINAPQAWETTTGSGDIKIAIIDRGVASDHEDLNVVASWDATDGDEFAEPNRYDGHGTWVAGVAAAVTNNEKGIAGTAWGSPIVSVRVFNTENEEEVTSDWFISEGILKAVDLDARVLLNSWGFVERPDENPAIESAIDYAIENNRVVVFSAGNGGGEVSWPANLSLEKTLIAVGGTNNEDQPSRNSNRGPEVTLVAPGSHVHTTDLPGDNGAASGDYYSSFGSTSSAAAFVAGAGVLLLSMEPDATPKEVRHWLRAGAARFNDPKLDRDYGAGLLDIAASLQAINPGREPRHRGGN